MKNYAAILFMVLPILVSCHEQTASGIQQAKQPPVATQQLPTATEVFHLRSECAMYGEKIMDNNVIGSALTQSQVSYYNPRTNRCYVELTVQSADMTKAPEVMSSSLYDGQTGEMLAFSEIKHGKQSGLVFKGSGVGFEDANQFINKTMNDD